MYVMNVTKDAETGLASDLASRVATRVRMTMAARQRTVRELASVLHLSDRAAQRRRAGEHPFSLRELEIIGKWLGVDPVVLLTGIGLEDVAA